VIELHKNQLIISFPEVHPKASGTVSFQRTLRVPDNDRIYPLPAGLGRFQLAHIDNYAENSRLYAQKRRCTHANI
jgi:hypothetical protein